MKMRKVSMLTAALCAVIIMCGFSVTAYAGGGEDYGDPTMTAEPVQSSVTAVITETPEPNPFTPSGTGTVVDRATDADGKEFYTITTPAENVFYLVIDRQRSVENVYFLNAVTEADLMALAEFSEEAATVIPSPEPLPDPTPITEIEPEPKQPEPKNNIGTLLMVAVVALVGGGAAWYFKVYRPRQQRAAESEEDYGGEFDTYGDMDDYGSEDEDDGPPWDDEDGDTV